MVEEEKEEDDVRFVIVERCKDIPEHLTTFDTRMSKCDECGQDVWVSKGSDSYMNKFKGERFKILCKNCWDEVDKGDAEVITSEESINDFDEWHTKHYGYKLSKDEKMKAIEAYTGRKVKIIK